METDRETRAGCPWDGWYGGAHETSFIYPWGVARIDAFVSGGTTRFEDLRKGSGINILRIRHMGNDEAQHAGRWIMSPLRGSISALLFPEACASGYIISPR